MKGRKMAKRKYNGRKKWTKEEEELLEKLSENYTKKDIAKKLGRSVSSVNCKRNQMGFGSLAENTDRWTFTQIAEAVGKDTSSISKTWVANGLKYVKRAYFSLVKEKDLHKFMKEHPHLWDATKCDYYLFYQYHWFMEKLEQDKKKSEAEKRFFWTDYEKSLFVSLKRKGVSHKEIASRLGKTKSAIDHMSMRMKAKQVEAV